MPRKNVPLSAPVGDVLLNDQATAERLGVSVSTVRRLRRDGELLSVKVRGSVRVPSSAVDRYLSDHVVSRPR